MKRRILFIVFLMFIIGLIFSGLYFIQKSKHMSDSEIINTVKSEFLSELQFRNPSIDDEISDFILLGQFGNGYILIRNNIIPAVPEISFDPVLIIIDDVSITYFPYTNFYYFENNLIIEGLDKIYEYEYIDKNDLNIIKIIFEEWKDYNYIVRSDYCVEYIFE